MHEISTVISFAGVLGGVLALGLWGFILVFTEHKVLPAQLRMKKPLEVLVIISSVVMTVMGLIALVQFFQNLATG